jgi:hypothetical protein
MDNYFNYFSRSLENSDFIRLTYQAFGIFVAIILLFLIAKFLKAAVNSRIRRINNITMDFSDLKQMRKTGLISDDEYEKIRSGLVKRFVQTPSPESIQPGEKLIEIPPLKANQDKELQQTGQIFSSSRKSEKPSFQPIDIEDLLNKGMISAEEYQKLSAFDRKKNIK